MDCRTTNKHISIIGTGDFARALGKRLLNSGYEVTFGSRSPEARNLPAIDDTFSRTPVTSVSSAILGNDVIILAVRVTSFEDVATKYRGLFSGKIVIDVSNRDRHTRVFTSNGEVLQSLIPEATVVKAFNVISAYAMDADFDGSSRVIPIASDSCRARAMVKDIARDMGFQPYDAGTLAAAKNIELHVMQLCPKWHVPIAITVGVFILWWLFVIYIYFIDDVFYSWEQIFVKVSNKPICMTAITLLGLTYLPGCLAAILQLISDTKHKRFPNWLDAWLKSRKQLGLICFLLASLHACISALLLSPTYYHSWFHGTDTITHGPKKHHDDATDSHMRVTDTTPKLSYGDLWMNWKGELSTLTGVLTYAILCILAVASLPTVADSLNWVEWRFVQSKFGFLALLMATIHAWIMGFPHWLSYTSWTEMLHSVSFMSAFLPAIVICLRVTQWLPCISRRLRKIRRGEVENAAPRVIVQSSKNRNTAVRNGTVSLSSAEKNGCGPIFEKTDKRNRDMGCYCGYNPASEKCCAEGDGGCCQGGESGCCCGGAAAPVEVKVEAASCCDSKRAAKQQEVSPRKGNDVNSQLPMSSPDSQNKTSAVEGLTRFNPRTEDTVVLNSSTERKAEMKYNTETTEDLKSKFERAAGLNSKTKRTAVVNSNTERTAVVNSNTERTVVVSSNTKRSAGVNSNTERTAVVNSNTERTAVVNSNTERTAVVNSNTERTVVVNSNTERTAVVNSNTERTAVVNSNTERTAVVNSNTERATGFLSHPERRAGLISNPERGAGLISNPERRAGLISNPERTSGLNSYPERASGLNSYPERASGFNSYPERTSGFDPYPGRISGFNSNPERTSRFNSYPERSKSSKEGQISRV